MLEMLKDKLFNIWESRFKNGASLSLGGMSVGKFANGEFAFSIAGPSVLSPATGHWPWFTFEASYLTGPAGSWHIGLLGFTVGMTVVHDIDVETQETVGPDKPTYYFFFKGINHINQQFEEIINA
jgi:hypothetical protein